MLKGVVKEFGDDLYSHIVARAVPSAQESVQVAAETLGG